MEEMAGLVIRDLENLDSCYYFLHSKDMCKWCLNASVPPLQKEEEYWCVLCESCEDKLKCGDRMETKVKGRSDSLGDYKSSYKNYSHA